MAKEDKAKTEEGSKKESGAGFIIAMVVGTAVALGSGWFAGTLMLPKGKDSQVEKVEKVAEKVETQPEIAEGDKPPPSENVSVLDPIIVILRNSDNTFLRLELAVVLADDAPSLSTEDKLNLKSELSAYSRTLSLRQISGPSGYLHFRDDLLDRVRLIVESAVEDVLVLSMVAE